MLNFLSEFFTFNDINIKNTTHFINCFYFNFNFNFLTLSNMQI